MHTQASILRSVFLETDAAISVDEGCTATVLLLQRFGSNSAAGPSDGHSTDNGNGGSRGWLMQSANVGDSSAVLVNITG
jgi:hypothetical protein